MPGFLAFLGYYEILSGFRLDFNFSVDRVTNVYRFQSPLFGGLELDFLVYAFVISYIVYIEEEGRDKVIYLVLVLASILGFFVSRFLGSTFLAYIVLGLTSLLSALFFVRFRDFRRLCPGILVSILFLEMGALVAVTSYFVFGSWTPIVFNLMMRERLFWAPLEWGSVLIFLFVMWSSFSQIFLGRPLFRPLRNKIAEASVKRVDSRFLLLLALCLTVIMVSLPHLPTVNPEQKPVSVDTPDYAAFFEEAERGGLSQALSSIGGRPAYLFFLYYVWSALSCNEILFMDFIHPIVALLLITVASYYAVRRLHGERRAGYAAILVPLGYTIPAFVAGGFQANSLALTTAILALTIKLENRAELAKLTLFLTLTALIHPWTHLMYTAAIIAYNLRDRKRLLSSLIAAALSYIVSNVVDYYLVSIHASVDAVRSVSGSAGFYLFGSWFDAIRFWVWNALSNPVYLSSSALVMDGWVASIMSVAVPLTLILPAGLIFRVILNIPLQLKVSKAFEDFPVNYQALIFLILVTRVLGNLSGLTPLEASVFQPN